MAHRTATARRSNPKAGKSVSELHIIDLITRLRELRAEAVEAIRDAESIDTPAIRVEVEYGAEEVDQAFSDAIARLAHAR